MSLSNQIQSEHQADKQTTQQQAGAGIIFLLIVVAAIFAMVTPNAETATGQISSGVSETVNVRSSR